MQAQAALWQIANFFAPAWVMGGVAAATTRFIWRRELVRTSLLRLWLCASGATALVSIAGLIVFEHDGRMLTYAAMVVACAAALWWAGFRAGKR